MDTEGSPSDRPLRKIIHVDMDAFYASVEQRDNPELHGKPVVVGGSPYGRGVVAAASYEARRYGIHSAMPCAHAHQRCPDAIFVKPRFEVYREVSRQIRTIFLRYTDLIEPLSLDEAYLDVTENKVGIELATEVAERIREEIRAETGLTASAGVAPNKFLAKIASDLDKPDGLAVIPPQKVDAFLQDLPVGKIHGIGRVTESKLHEMGVRTAGELQRVPLAELTARFGKAGKHFWRISRGIDERPVRPDRVRKSVGAESTFSADLVDRPTLHSELARLAAKVSQRMSRADTRGRTITLKAKYDDFTQITRSRTLGRYVDDQETLFATATELLDQETEAGERPIRLLGITVGNLEGVEEATEDPAVEAGQLLLPLAAISAPQ